MLSNQFLALRPQSLGGFAIECVRANAFTVDAQLPVLSHDLANVAVLAITSPDLVSRGNQIQPRPTWPLLEESSCTGKAPCPLPPVAY
jgi:hypothetical protein